MADKEAELVLQGCSTLNKALLPMFPGRTLESVKDVRRREDYKAWVEQSLASLRAEPPTTISHVGEDTDARTGNEYVPNKEWTADLRSMIADLISEIDTADFKARTPLLHRAIININMNIN